VCPIDSEVQPIFGSRRDGCPYIHRPSAYALITNDLDEIAVMRTPRGYFLPGGGVENGESPEMAVKREAREEGGLVLEGVEEFCSAIEYIESTEEHAFFEKDCRFFTAKLIDSVPGGERDHTLIWLPANRAAESLDHQSHAWAVQRLAKRDRLFDSASHRP